MKKKRFKVIVDDRGPFVLWEVWSMNGYELENRYAEFRDKGARKYAIAHAKLLNGLEREKQP